MVKFLLSLFLLFTFISANAQLQFQYNKAVGGATQNGNSIAIDEFGNTYIAGTFSGTIDVDPSASVSNITSVNSSLDIFFAKYDANGGLIWAKNIGSNSDEKQFDLAADATGVYIVGTFIATIDFDPNAGTQNLTFLGGGTDGDGFFAKYDVNGNYIFAKRLGSTANDRCLGIVVDAGKNIFVSGFVGGNADMDPGTGTVTFTVSSTYNAYFAKYDSLGNYIWAKQITGAGSDANDITLDNVGNIYITGSLWNSNNDFNPGVGTVNFSTSGSSTIAMYIAKYSPTGNYINAKRIAGIGLAFIDIGMQIKVDSIGNVYLGGTFNNSCDFDPSTTATYSLTSAGSGDLFVAKYDSTLTFKWANRAGGTSNDYANAMNIDADGNIYFAGRFNGSNIDFDPSSTNTALLSSTVTSMYLASFNNAGALRFAYKNGVAASQVNALTVRNSNLYLVGNFSFAVDYDWDSTQNNQITSVGTSDVFFAKYGISTSLQATDFTAKINGSDNILRWKCFDASEVDYFEVQQSCDYNNEFKTIASIPATINIAYNFIDKNVSCNISNYRISTAYKNGNTKLTDARLVVRPNIGFNRAYEITFTNGLASITNTSPKTQVVNIYTTNGAIVLSSSIASKQRLDLPTEKIAAGTYILKVGNSAAQLLAL
jgi:hypothetical protein